eukprot:1142671-Pelagomonas_calceolata.AAC.5
MERDRTCQDAAHASLPSNARGKHKSSISHQQECTAWMLKQKYRAGWQERLDAQAKREAH